MLKRIIKLPELIKNKLASDTEIIRLLNSGRAVPLQDIKDQITTKLTLTTTELNERSNAQAFISITVNTMVQQPTSIEAIIMVACAANTSLPSEQGTSVGLLLTERVVSILADSSFNLPSKLSFMQTDHAYFDDERNIEGQLIAFAAKDGDQNEDFS